MPHVDLLELPYFEGISINDMVGVIDLMAPRRFEVGEVIIREGDRGPTPLYIATKGNVTISKRSSDASAECTLAELNSPTLFGEVELFCEIDAVATITATTRVDTFLLTRATFDKLFAERHPAIMRFVFNVARVACHRLAIADEMMTQVVGDKDLSKIRQAVYLSLASRGEWASTTGTFKRPRR